MRSWIFRHLRRLEAIYGAEGRPRPVTEPNGERAAAGGRGPARLRLVEIRPQPTRLGSPDPGDPQHFRR